MPLDVTRALTEVLTATQEKASAEARIARYRAALEDEARAEASRRGVFPEWTAAGLGVVEYRAPGPWTPAVGSPELWTTWAAQHVARETATVTITVPAALAEAALEALDFAGITATATTIIPTDALANLTASSSNAVDEPPAYYWTDPDTGEDHPAEGIRATRSVACLRINLDPARKRGAIAAGEAAANTTLAELGEGAPDHEPLRLTLELYKREVLAGYAQAVGMSSGGTKAQLAERLARYVVDADPATLPADLADAILDAPADDAEPPARHLHAVPGGTDPVAQAAVDLAAAQQFAGVAAAYADARTLDELKLEARQLGRSTTGTKVAVARRILLARRSA